MPSTKKTRKPAKTATATRSGRTSAKAKSSMTRAPAKSKTSKAAATKSRTSASRTASKGKARAAASARGSAKTTKGGAASKARSVARSAAKGAAKTGELKATAKAKAIAKKAAEAAKKEAAKKKAAAAREEARKAAKKVSKTEPKVSKIKPKADKVAVKAAAPKETSPEKIKVTPSKKATETRTARTAPAPDKPVHPTIASVETGPAKPTPGKAWAETRASMARIAPDQRPAPVAPAVQPQTSEKIPVTQKKSNPPVAAIKSIKPVSQPAAEPVRAAQPPAKVAKPAGGKLGFKTNEHIVYPAHGVGQIVAIEEQEVAGFTLELFVISFAKDKMILKVPTPKVVSVGMRKLAEAPVITRSLETLTGRARIKRTMWSRRAQEYEAKINSGDLIAIAEVVRDLYRSEAQPEQSYSERQLYEAALDRMSRELAVVQKLTEQESLKLIEAQLQKGPRRGAKVEVEADGDSDIDSGDIDEAA